MMKTLPFGILIAAVVMHACEPFAHAESFRVSGGQKLLQSDRMTPEQRAANRLDVQVGAQRLQPESMLSARLVGEVDAARHLVAAAEAPLRLLNRTAKENRLRQDGLTRLRGHNDMDVQGSKALTLADLRVGVKIGAGWLIRIPAPSIVELHHTSGAVTSFEQDPHMKRKDGLHYGDWTSDKVFLALPSQGTDDRVSVYCQSTGGTQANGWGYPLRLMAISDMGVVTMEALNTESPSGSITADPLAVLTAYSDDLNAAHVYGYDVESTEFRTTSGHRMAPPAGQENYTVKIPAVFADPDAFLTRRVRWAHDATNGQVSVKDQELAARMGQLLAGIKNPDAKIRAAAETLLCQLDQHLDNQIAYEAARSLLTAQAREMAEQITSTKDMLRASPSTDLLKKKSDELIRWKTKATKLNQQLEEMKARQPKDLE